MEHPCHSGTIHCQKQHHTLVHHNQSIVPSTKSNANQCATTQHTPAPVCCPLSCVPTQPHHPSMLICRPVCPTPALCTPRCLCCSNPTSHRSCLVCVQHISPLQHHLTPRCHWAINKCATLLHTALHKTKHTMCCLSLSIKHPHKPLPTILACSLLSWPSYIQSPRVAVVPL